MKGFGMDALTQSFPASKNAAFPAKMAAVHFYQIVGRTYRGETQAVTSAKNVFYCLSGLEMLRPVHSQSFRPGRGIKWF